MLLLIGQEKGGPGKSTIAVNLAAISVTRGVDTLLVDADPQGTACAWSGLRSDAGVEPPIHCMEMRGPDVAAELLAMRAGRLRGGRVIVDAGGRDSTELRQSLGVADLALIPVRPSQFDTWSIDRMCSLLSEITARVGHAPRAAVVLNMVSTHPRSREAEEVRAFLAAHYGGRLTVLRAQLGERVAFRHSVREGRGVTEMFAGHDPKAAAEMDALYEEIFVGDSPILATRRRRSAARHPGAPR